MKRYECVMQDGPKDCGICALLTIIKTYGGFVSKEYLRNLTNTTSSTGVNAFSLLEAGKKIGFFTQGVRGDILKIEEKYLPCIAHVIIDNKYKHFVVIHKIDYKNNNVIIADPSRGIIKVDVDKFRAISTDNYLFFIPNKNLPIMTENNLIKNKTIDFIFNNKQTLITILIFSLIYTIINILISFNFQFVIERAINPNSLHNLKILLFLFVLIYALKNIVSYFREKLLNFISHKIDYILINDSLSHILSLPHLYFKNRTTGETLSRITDLGELKELLSNFIITIFVDLIIVLVTLITILSINKKLSFIVITILLLYSFLSLFFNRLLQRDIETLKSENATINSSVIELINGVNSIKSLNILERMKEDFSIIYNKYLNASYTFSQKLCIKNLVDGSISSIISLIIFIIGGGFVIKGNMKLTSLITFNSIIIYNFTSIRNILNFEIIIKKSRIIIERINELLNIKEEKIYFDLNPLRNIHGDIQIKNLSYSYGDNRVINNLTIRFNEGRKILIYGNSGCGKSTLAKILSGMLTIKRGKVFFGEDDLNDINLWNLREQVTYVSQDEYIFNNSIYENINIRKARDKNKILEISKCMLVDEIVNENKSGYNMLLEENARNISGGERQRILLARTFLKNSSIYILDETFSEINVDKERIILKNIFNRFKNKTIIVISHRFDNNDLYDDVYNLDEYRNKQLSKEF